MENIFKKYWWVLLVIIIILLLVIAWLIFMYKSDKADSPTSSTPTPATATPAATQKPTSETSETETESDADLLKKAVSEKSGIAIDLIIVEVSENTGKYAKGLVSAKGETVGGGYWLAVKTAGKWTVVFDGQSTPECTLVDPPGFPVSMVAECLDASGNLVARN